MAENLQSKKVTIATHCHTVFGGELSND